MLLRETLVSGLRGMFDERFEAFNGFPSTLEGAVEELSEVIGNYGGQVTPPSTLNDSAKEDFKAIMLNLSNNPNNVANLFPALFPQAMAAYWLKLASGMVGFVATPPAASVNVQLFLTYGSAQETAEIMATEIDSKMRTGTAVPLTGGAIIPWA